MSIRAGLLLGAAVDAVLGDPRPAHPVSAFGRASRGVQARTERDSRLAGLVHVATCVGAAAAVGAIGRRRTLWVGAATWTALGATTLAREASGIADALAAADLDEARRRLPALVGRDPSTLDTAGITRAVIESVAENTSDAVVAPLLWGAAFGAPGLLGFRAINTLDAMIGHHSPRYERFGWAAARLDDVAGLVPARFTAALAAALAPIVDGSTRRALNIWQAHGWRHPSPNAGPVEASFAGALGLRLGGPVEYDYGTSERPWLGDGADPVPNDIARAIRLSRAVGIAALVFAATVARP